MSAINELIKAVKDHITFCIKHRYNTSVLVQLASQNVYIVRFELAKHYISLNDANVDFTSMSADEIMEKGERYRQQFYFSHQINIEVVQKSYPNPSGDFLSVDVNRYNRLYHDLDPCQEGQMALTAHNPEI